MLIVKVALPIPLIKTFNYLISNKNNILYGIRVEVSFNKRKYIGIITDSYILKNSLFLKKIKKVIKILDKKPLFSKDIWFMLLWSINYYHYPIGKVLFYVLPNILKKNIFVKYEKTLEPFFIKKSCINTKKLKYSKKQKKALKMLNIGPLKKDQINKLGLLQKTFKYLYKKKLCDFKFLYLKKVVWISFFKKKYDKYKENINKIDLNSCLYNENKFSVWLLSHNIFEFKIKIYLKILENMFFKKKQVLFIVPRKSLTLKFLNIFKKYFYISMTIFHSKINQKKKLSIWLKIKNGEYCVIIGTKSSVFVPLKKLGIIIVCEEHNILYKKNNKWMYNARDLSILRAKIKNIPIILESSTPSMETLNNVNKKKYNILFYSNKINNIKFFNKKLINIKEKKLIYGIYYKIFKKIKKQIILGNQVLIFLQENDVYDILSCLECGYTFKCLFCKKNYIYIKNNKKLYCKFCKYTKSSLESCLKCFSKKIISETSIEKIKNFFLKKFLNISVFCIDKKKSYKEQQKDFFNIKNNNYQILIGANSLINEYDFPNATLFCILNIDNIFFSKNFRSSEYFLQTYTKIFLKSYHKNNKEILLQTKYPKHPFLNNLIKLKYIELSYIILKERYLTMFPPFKYDIIFYSKDYNNIYSKSFLNKIKILFNNNIFSKKKLFINLLSYTFKPQNKIKFIWKLLIRGSNRKILHNICKKNLKFIKNLPEAKKVYWNIDVDPV